MSRASSTYPRLWISWTRSPAFSACRPRAREPRARGRFAPPEAELTGEPECAAEPGLVSELLEDRDRAGQLAPDAVVAVEQSSEQSGGRSGRRRRSAAVLRSPAALRQLHRLGEDCLGEVPLAALVQRPPERGEEDETAWIVGRIERRRRGRAKSSPPACRRGRRPSFPRPRVAAAARPASSRASPQSRARRGSDTPARGGSRRPRPVRRGRAVLVEPGGEALVQLGAARLRERVVGRVADQQMAEAERVLAREAAAGRGGAAPCARGPSAASSAARRPARAPARRRGGTRGPRPSRARARPARTGRAGRGARRAAPGSSAGR